MFQILCEIELLSKRYKSKSVRPELVEGWTDFAHPQAPAWECGFGSWCIIIRVPKLKFVNQRNLKNHQTVATGYCIIILSDVKMVNSCVIA